MRSLKTYKKGLFTALLAMLTVISAVLAGTQHIEYGYVQNASDATASSNSEVRIYNTLRPNDVISSSTDTSSPSLWYKNVGEAMIVQWQVGDDHVVLIDKEINPGTATRKGYYAVSNIDITEGNDEYNHVLRPIPVPVGTPGDNQASLAWTAAEEDPGVPVRTNITGYRILRSTSQTGPYTFLATVEGSTSYTDTSAVNGTTYYYVIQLVYRVSAGTPLVSAYYSGNSNAVTPSAGPPPGVIIIDDYEDPNPRTYYNAGDVLPTYSVGTDDPYEGAKSVQVGYSYTGSGWGGLVGGVLPNNLDISSATGVSFWLKGDGSNNTIRIDLKEATNEAPANGEVYSSTDIPLSNTGWQKIELPYSAFVRNPYDGVTGGNNSFDKNIYQYQLMYTGTNVSGASHFVDYIVAETISVSGAPTVTDVNPDTGENTSATPVVITGTNFGGTTAVKIGTWDVTSFTVDSALQISAVIPAGLPVGTYHVTVTNGYGTSATSSADEFTVTAPVSTVPTVTGVTPNSGVNTSTTPVTIEGTNFTGVTAVNIGTWPVSSFTVDSGTQISATIPAGLPVGTYHVTVTNGSGTSATSPASQFTVTSGGPAFDGVVIDDFEFYAERDHRGMMDYYYESGSGVDEVTMPAPANSTTVVQEGVRSMQMTYPGAAGAQWGGYWGGGLTIEAKDLTPYSGISLWVKGDGTGNTIVVSLKEADVSGVEQEAYISVAIPLANTSWHKVEIPFSSFVRDPYGVLLEGAFSKVIKGYTIVYRGTQTTSAQHFVDYLVAENISLSNVPTVTDVTPDTGVNTSVTPVVITGTNFGGATAVRIGTWPVSSFTVDAATQISAVIQSGLPAGTYHVTVTNPYGTSSTSPADQFTVTVPTVPGTAPAVTGINPNTGENTTSTEVTITGTGLDGAYAAHIGTFEMTIVSVTPTQVIAIVPPGIPAGDYHITVTTPNGTSAETPNDIFTVTEPSGPVSDTTPPVISDVRFDDKPVMDGDFVARTPVITALLTDDVAIDPSSIRVRLINVYDTGSSPAVTFDPATGRMRLAVTSPLPYGETAFSISVSDTSGNSAEFRITLNGNDGSVFNYPNPFDPTTGGTKIAFNIRENTQVTIYLFDTTGRIVVKRPFNATVGFNEYEWDGRDDYGTMASNGVYLLRLVSGSRLIGKTKIWVIKR